MALEASILGKVIEAKHAQVSVSPEELLHRVITEYLSEREQEIVRMRYGLKSVAHTLDAIGKRYSITRERVRQITKQAILKLARAKAEIEELKILDRRLRDLVERSGGLRSRKSLGRDFYETAPSDLQHAALHFFIDHLSDHLERSSVGDGWQLVGAPSDLHPELLDIVKNLLDERQDPHTVEALHRHLDGHDGYNSWCQRFLERTSKAHEEIDWLRVLEAYLELSDDLKRNPFSEWGLKFWPSVNPRRIADKIYLVLKRRGEPMHFEDITNSINEHSFDGKKAHAPTVHNELILNDNFVLIGRGIYALAEWGYTSGTVADVIEAVLAKAEEPLNREAIVEAVLEQRQVKEGTVLLALNDKNRFVRHDDGTYSLVNETGSQVERSPVED